MLYVIHATLWYVFPAMENVVMNIYNTMDTGEKLLVVQNFPPLDSAFVGKEVIPTPVALIEWFRKPGFVPLFSIWMENHCSKGNDNWFIVLFQK